MARRNYCNREPLIGHGYWHSITGHWMLLRTVIPDARNTRRLLFLGSRYIWSLFLLLIEKRDEQFMRVMTRTRIPSEPRMLLERPAGSSSGFQVAPNVPLRSKKKGHTHTKEKKNI